MNDFYTYVKTAIDTIGVQIALAADPQIPQNLKYINLDATSGVEEVLKSADPAIVWQLASLRENPRRPLWTLVFLMGAKTTEDMSNQLMSLLISQVQKVLPAGQRIPILWDHGSGPVDEGTIIIQSSGVDEQEFDNQNGIRFLPVTAGVIEGNK